MKKFETGTNSECNPFVVVRFMDQVHRTSTSYDDLNPSYYNGHKGKLLHIPVYCDDPDMLIQFELWTDVNEDSKCLGSIAFPL